MTYDAFVTANGFPNPGIAYLQMKNNPFVKAQFEKGNVSADAITYELIERTMASVVIYFDDIKYTRISESPSRSVNY